MATEPRRARPAATGLWTVIAGVVLLVTGWGSIVRMRYPDGIWTPTVSQQRLGLYGSDSLLRIRRGAVSIREESHGWEPFGTLIYDDGGWWFAMDHTEVIFDAAANTLPGHPPSTPIELDPVALQLDTDTSLDGPWRWSFWRSLFVW